MATTASRSTSESSRASRRQRSLTGALALAICASLTACGSTGTSAIQADTPSATTTFTSTEPTTAAPAITSRFEVPQGDLEWNGSSLYTNCSADMQEPRTVKGQLFDPKRAQNLPLPRLSVPAGDEITQQACAIAQNANGQYRVVYLVTIKTPAKGLQVESHRAEMASFDVNTQSQLASMEFTLEPLREEFSPWSLHPATNLVLFNNNACDTCPDRLAYFDPDTLKVVHAYEESRSDSGPNSPIVGTNLDGYANFSLNSKNPHASGFDTKDLHFFNTAGEEIGAFNNVDFFLTTWHGFLIERRDNADAKPEDRVPGVYYFDMRTRETAGPIAPYLDMDHKSASTPSHAAEFTYGDSILLFGNDSREEANFLTVFNALTTTEEFRLESEQIEGLKITDAHIAGGYLYLDNESDDPVIDMRTREPVHSGWSVRPTLALPDGWVWVNQSEPGKDSRLCPYVYGERNCTPGGQAEAGYLARGEDGGPFHGPWF